jgi:hypothetical protein
MTTEMMMTSTIPTKWCILIRHTGFVVICSKWLSVYLYDDTICPRYQGQCLYAQTFCTYVKYLRMTLYGQQNR